VQKAALPSAGRAHSQTVPCPRPPWPPRVLVATSNITSFVSMICSAFCKLTSFRQDARASSKHRRVSWLQIYYSWSWQNDPSEIHACGTDDIP
jgi:hypothetical protein